MALTNLQNSSTSSPDKMIRTGVDAAAIIYTVPAGRKFIGHAVIPSNSSSSVIYMKSDGTSAVSISGTSSYTGFSFPIYLNAGELVRGQYAAISGIESDA
jgi:hypothetical protein